MKAVKRGKLTYEDIQNLPKMKYEDPKRPSFLLRTLIKIISLPELWSTKFKCERIGLQRLKKKEPCLILMNHSCFLDLKIAESVFYPKPFCIVSTYDAFIGKKWLMRNLGCIPTKKFVTDVRLVKDMQYALSKLRCSVLMYPEAGYSFDGRSTLLPDSLGKCIKLLKVPVLMLKTDGAFLHQPLYNELRMRKVKVSATLEYLLSPEDAEQKSAEEISDIVKKQFSFDGFRSQQEKGVLVTEPERAAGLHRGLYRCPSCNTDERTEGGGTKLVCHACGKEYELTEEGFMRALSGKTEYAHIPDWYDWERECVRNELLDGSYEMEIPVEIRVLADTKSLYYLGEGVLTHNKDGFVLKGEDFEYTQGPTASYSLNSDFYWYETGDVICIGTGRLQYCLFTKDNSSVAKARLATEELYKLKKEGKI